MAMTYRGFIVWGAGIVGVLGLFLIFVAAGWPGGPDQCTHLVAGKQILIDGKLNSCYCEHFNTADVLSHASGVRQPSNTWFNLYAIITSGIVAIRLFFDRQSGTSSNPLRSMNPIADAYIFAVLFLGLGSMWFHASLSSAVSWVDAFSMYVFAGFLVYYAIYRLWPNDQFFWICYPVTVFAATVAGAFWDWDYASLILILILVVVYLVFEFIWAGHHWSRSRPVPIVLWSLGVLFILVATLFWTLSQTGAPLCRTASEAASAFQAHGMIWHPFAGVMATLLYFYWRYDDEQLQAR
jgi:hypothetical protein